MRYYVDVVAAVYSCCNSRSARSAAQALAFKHAIWQFFVCDVAAVCSDIYIQWIIFYQLVNGRVYAFHTCALHWWKDFKREGCLIASSFDVIYNSHRLTFGLIVSQLFSCGNHVD